MDKEDALEWLKKVGVQVEEHDDYYAIVSTSGIMGLSMKADPIIGMIQLCLASRVCWSVVYQDLSDMVTHERGAA